MPKKIISLIQKYKHMFISLLFIIQIGWFFYCERVVTVPKYIMFSPLDEHIPFIKEFIVFYIFWYPYMVIAFLYLGIKSKKDFYRLFIFIFLGMSIAHIIYVIYPNGQNLRPNITTNDIFSRAVKYIYSIDTPTNVAPSIHAVNSIAVYIAMAKCPTLKRNYFIKALLFSCSSLIILSTLFVKQHSLMDILYGILLSIVLYILIYIFPELFNLRFIEVNRNKKGLKKDASD